MEKELSMADFMTEIDESFRRLDRGDIVDCIVMSITESELLVGLEIAHDGVVPKAESGLQSGVALKDHFEIGQKCSAVVTHPNHPNGYIELSIKGALGQIEKIQIQEALDHHKTIFIQVLEEIKGGYRIKYGTTSGFMPFSQSGIMRDESPLALYDGNHAVQVLEYNDKKFLVSRRMVLDAEKAMRKTERIAELKEGEVLSGTITRLMPFGAFVDLGGIEGLIPLSEMGWKRVNSASDAVQSGQMVEVKVRTIQREEQKVSLSLKDLIQNPYDRIEKDYTVGESVQSTIRHILPFGLKVELVNGAIGFIHKSELNIPDVNSQLGKKFTVGDQIQAEVIGFDEERKQVVLSCLEQADDAYELFLEEEVASTEVTLGDLFKAKFEQLKKD